MAKNETAVDSTASAGPVDQAPIYSLDEFCSRLSETVKSPEAIGGFHFTERVAGAPCDTFEAYKARFDAFVSKPV